MAAQTLYTLSSFSSSSFSGRPLHPFRQPFSSPTGFSKPPRSLTIAAAAAGPLLPHGRRLRAAVVGGRPAGSPAAEALEGGGTVIKVEAHPIPEHPRPRRVRGRVALVGDAAGYVTKCSGEGIYFAAKSGRMCGQAIVRASEGGRRVVTEADLRREYLRRWDGEFKGTFRFLDLLQRVFYGDDAGREALVEMCGDEYVQRRTFESYLYKRIQMGNPLEELKLAWRTVGCLVRAHIVGGEMEKVAAAEKIAM